MVFSSVWVGLLEKLRFFFLQAIPLRLFPQKSVQILQLLGIYVGTPTLGRRPQSFLTNFDVCKKCLAFVNMRPSIVFLIKKCTNNFFFHILGTSFKKRWICNQFLGDLNRYELVYHQIIILLRHFCSTSYPCLIIICLNRLRRI